MDESKTLMCLACPEQSNNLLIAVDSRAVFENHRSGIVSEKSPGSYRILDMGVRN